MNEESIDIEVHYTFHVNKKYLGKILREAELCGLEYGDPGKQELVRRLLNVAIR